MGYQPNPSILLYNFLSQSLSYKTKNYLRLFVFHYVRIGWQQLSLLPSHRKHHLLLTAHSSICVTSRPHAADDSQMYKFDSVRTRTKSQRFCKRGGICNGRIKEINGGQFFSNKSCFFAMVAVLNLNTLVDNNVKYSILFSSTTWC